MNYIEQYKKLNKESKNIIMQPDYKQINKPLTIFNGFIGSETIIKPYSNPNSGFKLDDESLYIEFINLISSKERNFVQDIEFIQNYIDNYFGNNNINEIKNSKHDIHSISTYKNQGGECIHKSTVANNLLKILGYECELIWSNVNSENHAFLILHYQDKHYIYDPANHSRLYISDKQFYKIATLVEKRKTDIDNFYNNLKNLDITENDENIKNLKQTNTNYKIILPKLTYDCRNKVQFINLKKEKNVIDTYIEHLRKKGISNEEIQNILEKIKTDAKNGIKPKIETLDNVYEAMKTR